MLSYTFVGATCHLCSPNNAKQSKNSITTSALCLKNIKRIIIMTPMTTEHVAEFLGVKVERVKRLSRENLLVAKDNDADGQPIFDKTDVEKYKELAQRLGGI